jgi:hypothetical protein
METLGFELLLFFIFLGRAATSGAPREKQN